MLIEALSRAMLKNEKLHCVYENLIRVDEVAESPKLPAMIGLLCLFLALVAAL
jgi:hypothetical protein